MRKFIRLKGVKGGDGYRLANLLWSDELGVLGVYIYVEREREFKFV